MLLKRPVSCFCPQAYIYIPTKGKAMQERSMY